MRTLIVVLLVAFVAAEQKREAEPTYGVAGYGPGYGYGSSYSYGPSYGYGRGLGYGYGVISHHPYGLKSSVHSYNHILHKREAEPTYPYGFGLGYGYGPGIARHPYHGYSYVRSHGIGKREADPGYFYGYPGYSYGPAYGHGAAFGYSTSVKHPGYGHSYQHRSGLVYPSYGYH
nr:shematrin-like protein 1 [Cherax quadricarinatus]